MLGDRWVVLLMMRCCDKTAFLCVVLVKLLWLWGSLTYCCYTITPAVQVSYALVEFISYIYLEVHRQFMLKALIYLCLLIWKIWITFDLLANFTHFVQGFNINLPMKLKITFDLLANFTLMHLCCYYHKSSDETEDKNSFIWDLINLRFTCKLHHSFWTYLMHSCHYYHKSSDEIYL
jgi:hypothetical protein